jgi:hypothetical protein
MGQAHLAPQGAAETSTDVHAVTAATKGDAIGVGEISRRMTEAVSVVCLRGLSDAAQRVAEGGAPDR